MTPALINTLDTDQRRALENVRATAARIWSRPLHRYYTDHTVAHSERVIALLDGLTAGMMDTGKRLSPTEVLILVSAAYLHDIGMQNERFAGGDPSASSEQRLEEIRAHHHEQTAEMIYAVFEDPAHAFPIPLARDPGLVEAVALVAQGHRRVDLNGPEYEPLVHGGGTVRLRLLAALLRFGDELDIDHRRVDLEQMQLLDLPVESQLHWWKCHYVSGVSIADEYIRVSYRFPQDRPDYKGLIVPLVEGEVRAQHAALEEVFRAHAVKVALGRPQVRLMRLVQPLPPEVEALAWQTVGATEPPAPADESVAPTEKPSEGPALSRVEGAVEGEERAPVPPAQAATVFLDQTAQRVGTQVIIAGDATGPLAAEDRGATPPPTPPDSAAQGKKLAQEDAFGPGDERAALQRELAQHKRNLYKLREQAAVYAVGETPLHLLNQIEAEEKEIRRIEAELENLEA